MERCCFTVVICESGDESESLPPGPALVAIIYNALNLMCEICCAWDQQCGIVYLAPVLTRVRLKQPFCCNSPLCAYLRQPFRSQQRPFGKRLRRRLLFSVAPVRTASVVLVPRRPWPWHRRRINHLTCLARELPRVLLARVPFTLTPILWLPQSLNTQVRTWAPSPHRPSTQPLQSLLYL